MDEVENIYILMYVCMHVRMLLNVLSLVSSRTLHIYMNINESWQEVRRRERERFDKKAYIPIRLHCVCVAMLGIYQKVVMNNSID